MNFTQPNSEGRPDLDVFLEFNDCHSHDSGRFCSGPGSTRRKDFQGRSVTDADLSPGIRRLTARKEREIRQRAGRKKDRFMDKIMNQEFNYGGVMTSRANVIRDLQKQGRSQKEIDRYMQGLEISQGLASWRASTKKPVGVGRADTKPGSLDQAHKIRQEKIRKSRAKHPRHYRTPRSPSSRFL